MMAATQIFAQAAESIHKLRQTQINTYAAYSHITLYAYDILLNLAREKQLIWADPFRFSSILYYFVRYPVIAKQIFSLFSNPHMKDCDTWYRFTSAITLVIVRIAIVVSFVLRVYAVMERGIFFVCVLSILGLLAVVLDVVQVTELSCTETSNPLAFMLTFISLIVFDIIAMILLTWKTASVVRLQGGVKQLGSESVVWLIMKNGTLYFIVITGIQLGAVVLYFLPQGLYSTVLNDYTLIISSILVSRFLLDLRFMSSSRADDRFHSTRFTSLHFATGPDVERSRPYRSRGMSFICDFGDPPASDTFVKTHSTAEEIAWD
ncbi:hypothetical protein BDQ17DRAFT_1365344 [Cyathus striatus]|nr:hypothetical protein BDQ17DRAFT_1365344 [Cyathus striatus]